MPILLQRWISRADVIANRGWLYVFGDNDLRTGLGGQAAAMRGEPNAVGVRVKRWPSMSPGSFWTDEEYLANVRKIAEDLRPVVERIRERGTVVLPADGIGTGRARLSETAPQTFEFLRRTLDDLAGLDARIERKNSTAQVISLCSRQR